ncbi:MAG TPA: DUF1896 family protein [Dysgonomonas sp.]|uniref:DUF1896 family protein n=1 Tax=unclassified Dysgonomonas TaxID=2630389 RepID=UPI0025BFF156|nr:MULTISPECIES: DUF1896 family protein [unclassified Dysgonomonas]HML65245.1 DUF1896 family protein [Dysgonomonas sp.]
MKGILAPYNRTYFEDILQNYLKAYHPDLSDDRPFLSSRTDESFSLYHELISDGVADHAAYDLAVKVLFDEL